MMQKLLEVRKESKERKPDFIRQDTHKRRKLDLRWKKPKGLHSKMRHKFKGHRKMPSPGYKSPAKVRGLHSSGLKMISVFSIEDIVKIKKESEGAVISKTIGMRKRLGILKKAKELDSLVLNLNVDSYIKKIEDIITSKKKKEAKEVKKEPRDKKEIKETAIKENKTDALTAEEKKEAEKKEKDKLLTKKT